VYTSPGVRSLGKVNEITAMSVTGDPTEDGGARRKPQG
jgi:hypothetical protein